MRVALIPHPERKSAYALAVTIATHLESAGVEVRLPSKEAAAMEREDLGVEFEKIGEGAEIAISIGGDGTMLRALGAAKGVPVLGVNLGALGFLTEVEPEEAVEALDRLVNGDYVVDERMTLDSSVRTGRSDAAQHRAVNEISVEKANPQRMVEIEVTYNGEHFTTFRSDGVLVATATGSTAYAMSLRGPIVSPGLECLVVVPIAPHGLFDRSMLLAPSEEVILTVQGDRDAVLAVDGQRQATLGEGESVTIRRGEEPARFIRLHSQSFHHVIKKKFGLSDLV